MSGIGEDVYRRSQGFRDSSLEVAVVGAGAGGLMQVEDPTDENDGSGEEDTSLKHAPDGDLEFLVGYLHLYNLPVMLLMTISRPKATMTTAKTMRSVFTSARTRIFEPTSDPPRTPSITGMARPGEMYPRLR